MPSAFAILAPGSREVAAVGRVRRALSSRLRPLWFAALARALCGCDAGSFEIGESTSSSGSPGARERQRFTEDECPERAELRRSDPSCWPTRHVGRWHGFATGDARYHHVLDVPWEYPSDGISLTVEPSGAANLVFAASAQGVAAPGTLVDAGPDAAGAAAVRVAASRDAGRSDAAAAPGSGAPPGAGLVPGFAYHLAGVRMQGGPREQRREDPRIEFSLLIAEPWSDFCVSLPAAVEGLPCECTPEGCRVSSEGIAVSLALSADAQALRGSAFSQSSAGQFVAGLEFVREE